jgi:hypothetical protein
MKPRTPLTDEEKTRATTLHASGMSVYAVAKTLGRSPHTLAKFLRSPAVVRQVGIQREELALLFDGVGKQTLDAVSDEDVRKASLLQKMTSAAICVDKAAMLRGQATSTIDIHVLMDLLAIVRGDNLDQPQSPPLLPPPENQK